MSNVKVQASSYLRKKVRCEKIYTLFDNAGHPDISLSNQRIYRRMWT